MLSVYKCLTKICPDYVQRSLALLRRWSHNNLPPAAAICSAIQRGVLDRIPQNLHEMSKIPSQCRFHCNVSSQIIVVALYKRISFNKVDIISIEPSQLFFFVLFSQRIILFWVEVEVGLMSTHSMRSFCCCVGYSQFNQHNYFI